MQVYFVDTSFWVARFNSKDERHRDAIRIWEDLKAGARGPFRLVTTDFVFDESVTLVKARARDPALASEAGRRILASPALRFEHVSPLDFERGWEMFQEREDKGWSFTDCTSFCCMERHGMRQALSFDENFAQAGFAVLP